MGRKALREVVYINFFISLTNKSTLQQPQINRIRDQCLSIVWLLLTECQIYMPIHAELVGRKWQELTF